MAINWSGLAEQALGGLFNFGTSLIGGSVMSGISNRQLRQNMAYQNNWQAQQAEIARDWQADQAQVQNAWSEKMNAQQQDWQEGMWNKTNEWNSEGARMQRLLDAGVNPNNAAGLISGNNTAAQLAQQPQIPTANPYPSTSIPNGGSMQGASLLDGVNAMNNTKLVDFQRRKTDSEIKLNEMKEDEIVANIFDLVATRDSRIDLNKATAFKAWNEGDYSYYATNVIYWDGIYGKERTQASLAKVRAEAWKATEDAMKTSEEKETVRWTRENILPLQARFTNEQIRTAIKQGLMFVATAKNQLQQAKNGVVQEQILQQQLSGDTSDAQLKILLNNQLKKEATTFGSPIKDMPIDDLSKIILYISTHNPDNAENIVDAMFDTFAKNAGHYLSIDVMKHLGNGQGDAYSRGYAAGMLMQNMNLPSPQYQTSDFWYSPSTMYNMGY